MVIRECSQPLHIRDGEGQSFIDKDIVMNFFKKKMIMQHLFWIKQTMLGVSK